MNDSLLFHLRQHQLVIFICEPKENIHFTLETEEFGAPDRESYLYSSRTRRSKTRPAEHQTFFGVPGTDRDGTVNLATSSHSPNLPNLLFTTIQ